VSALVIAAVTATVISNGGDEVRKGSGGDANVRDKATSSPLRTQFSLSDPGIFYVAFEHDPGLPPENAGWQDLIRRGGVDVYSSLFKVTLANRSDEPLTIRDIHVKLVGSVPPPTGAYAYAFTQGGGSLGQFAVRMNRTKPGAVLKLYKVVDDEPGWARDPPDKPFFDGNYISLQPGEIYEATILVRAEAPNQRMVSYRFVVAGSTPRRSFAIREHRVFRLSGLLDGRDTGGNSRYEHYYVSGYLGYVAGSCPSVHVRQWFEEATTGLPTTSCP
jgi:hypothetical protein